MEIVKPLPFKKKKSSLVLFGTAHEMYAFAREHVFANRRKEYETSRDSILKASKVEVSEHWFFREYVWCVHVAGFSAARVSKFYQKLLVAHNIEDDGGAYIQPSQGNVIKGEAMERVYAVWRNRAKAATVQKTRQLLVDVGWPTFKVKFVADRDPGKIGQLPFMGPALSRHLARNLGNVNVVKPDVHLNRLADKYGFESAEAMCKAVSDDPPGMTDLIIWYAAQDHGTI